MGSMITLGIGRMEIDWGKNSSFRNHSVLFKTSDVKPIPYYYVDMDSDEPIIELKEGYARKLSSIKRRLDLLGYDLASIRKMFEDAVREHQEYGYKIKLSFDVFYDVLRAINISEIDTVKLAVEFEENGYDFGEYARRCILNAPEVQEKLLLEYEEVEDNEYQDPEGEVSEFLENLDPYITLRILADNPTNAEQEVFWGFADVVENGWVRRDEVVRGLPLEKRILIVTEGSSDSYVLRKAIDQLYPDISDFFDQSQTLQKPDSFVIIKLPYYQEFSSICTLGPQGSSMENINGRAVAIECFLDFSSVQKVPCVRWTSYNKNERQYQGELENKDEYIRAFKQCDFTDGSYDPTKLEFLIEYIISQWIDRKNNYGKKEPLQNR